MLIWSRSNNLFEVGNINLHINRRINAICKLFLSLPYCVSGKIAVNRAIAHCNVYNRKSMEVSFLSPRVLISLIVEKFRQPNLKIGSPERSLSPGHSLCSNNCVQRKKKLVIQYNLIQFTLTATAISFGVHACNMYCKSGVYDVYNYNEVIILSCWNIFCTLAFNRRKGTQNSCRNIFSRHKSDSRGLRISM